MITYLVVIIISLIVLLVYCWGAWRYIMEPIWKMSRVNRVLPVVILVALSPCIVGLLAIYHLTLGWHRYD